MPKINAQTVAILREMNIRKARDSFWAYCCLLSPDFYKSDRWHLWLICETLQALYERRLTKSLFHDLCTAPNVPKWYVDTVDWDRLHDGIIYTRLMQNLPPRHGKSRTLVNFCDWVLGKNMQNRIITVSYNTDLAADMSRYVRDGIAMKKNLPTQIVYNDIFPNSRIARGNSSFMKWALEGCFFNYLGAGLEGTITGKGANCLGEYTWIFTDKGYVRIRDLVGNEEEYKVLSFNHKENRLEFKSIVASRKVSTKKLISFWIDFGTHTNYIDCTENHLFFVDGSYKMAKFLKTGDKIKNIYGKAVVTTINSTEYESVDVYDIQVADNHNFFAEGVLTHNCSIIDDPIKNAEEAYNDKTLENIWNWYTGTFLSRSEKEGDGSIDIVNHTRWNTNDLCGRIIGSKMGPKWLILSMPVENDGEMLCPSILPYEDFVDLRDNMDPNIFRANYYQEPVDIKGRLFESFIPYDELPDGIEKFIAYCDTADEGKDYLACIMGGIKDGEGFITDVYFTQDPMTVTEPETAKRLVENKINHAKIESNNGGRGFARNVEKHIWDDFHTRQVNITWFHQTENKMARILTGASFVMKHVHPPKDWATRWPEFYLSIMSFQKTGGNKHDDGAEALVEWGKMITGDGSINSYLEMMKRMKERR